MIYLLVKRKIYKCHEWNPHIRRMPAWRRDAAAVAALEPVWLIVYAIFQSGIHTTVYAAADKPA